MTVYAYSQAKQFIRSKQWWIEWKVSFFSWFQFWLQTTKSHQAKSFYFKLEIFLFTRAHIETVSLSDKHTSHYIAKPRRVQPVGTELSFCGKPKWLSDWCLTGIRSIGSRCLRIMIINKVEWRRILVPYPSVGELLAPWGITFEAQCLSVLKRSPKEKQNW